MATITKATITCPRCGFEQESEMPTDACQFFFQCVNCHSELRPREGDCCVYCSFADKPCPVKQQAAIDASLDDEALGNAAG